MLPVSLHWRNMETWCKGLHFMPSTYLFIYLLEQNKRRRLTCSCKNYSFISKDHLVWAKYGKCVAVLKECSYSKKRCLERREKCHKCNSEGLPLGTTLTQEKENSNLSSTGKASINREGKRENSKFPGIGKASISHEAKSIGNQTSLAPELTALVTIRPV